MPRADCTRCTLWASVVHVISLLCTAAYESIVDGLDHALGGVGALRLRLKAYVLDTRHEKALESDVSLRVLKGMQGQGIMPPAVLHRHLDAPVRPARTRARSASVVVSERPGL